MASVSLQDFEDRLFSELVVSNPRKRRTGLGMPVSIVTHVGVASAIVLLPILWPEELPELGDPLRVLIYAPPAAAAPPLPKGVSGPAHKVEPAKPTTPEPKPEKPKLEAPIEVPREQPLRAEARLQESLQIGSETGSDMGVPEGMEGGLEGGLVGGVLGGVVGGCVGCDGDGPVLDYDQQPRVLKQTKPVYPQDAFVKKISGTVYLEILIDATGRVHTARVLRSVSPALDQAAKECVLQWQFAPAMRRGRPVAVLAQAPVAFNLY
jgi:protein TonB